MAAAAEPRRMSAAVSPPTVAIDLCSSSDEEEARGNPYEDDEDTLPYRVADDNAAAPARAEKRKAEQISGENSDDSDDDCRVVEPPAPTAKRPAPGAAAAATAPMDEDSEEDVVIEGQSGAIALIDFPHARNNCVMQPFRPGNFASTCANCYCYVCDAPAGECAQWQVHCSANNDDPAWRAERARVRRELLDKQLVVRPPPPAAAAAAAAPRPAAAAAAAAAPPAARLQLGPGDRAAGLVVNPNRRRGVRYRALVRCKIRAGVAKDSAEIGFLEVDDVIDVVSTATEAGVKRIQFNKKWRGADGQERTKLGWVSVVTAGGKELLADRAREAEEEERVAALDAERKRREEEAKRARERREAEDKRRAEEKRLLEQEAARPERQISCQNLLKRAEQVSETAFVTEMRD